MDVLIERTFINMLAANVKKEVNGASLVSSRPSVNLLMVVSLFRATTSKPRCRNSTNYVFGETTRAVFSLNNPPVNRGGREVVPGRSFRRLIR